MCWLEIIYSCVTHSNSKRSWPRPDVATQIDCSLIMFHINIHCRNVFAVLSIFIIPLLFKEEKSVIYLRHTVCFYWSVLLLSHRNDVLNDPIDLYDPIFRKVSRLRFKPVVEADIYIIIFVPRCRCAYIYIYMRFYEGINILFQKSVYYHII